MSGATDGAFERGRITPAFLPVQREKPAPCQAGCGAAGDVRGWIAVVAQHERLGLSRDEAFARAWHIITECNPFPATLGRICPHPCEDHCNRALLDEPLAINAMERFLGDWAIARGIALPPPPETKRRERIGVVGAGPSGLSFAWQMTRRGYDVTVYEGRDQPGGMLRYGIPDYRLPPAILDAEIQRLLDAGVTLRVNARVGRELTWEALRGRHDALYIAVGAQRGRSLGIPGETGVGSWTGVEFLRRINCGERPDLGSDVVVIGGGNTAVDAARAARRAGANVTILYRRSREEMPAIAHEVDDALEEGVELILLAAPVRVERRHGRPHRLIAQRMQLADPDASGRRRAVSVPDSEFELPASAFIAAVSQEPDLEGLADLAVDHGWLITREGGDLGDGVWAGGDALGLGIAGFAIAHGRRAAETLDARLRGAAHPAAAARSGNTIDTDRIKLEYHERVPAAHRTRTAPAVRLANPAAEVSAGITEEQMLREASRCYSCGSCFGCQQCAMYCTVGCYTPLEEPRPGAYFTLSLGRCEECGKCVEVCPCGFLEAQ